MAEKKSYPMLPAAHWWSLREKFKQSIPGIVTTSYLAAALNMQVESARANVLPFLRDLGIIDEEGKTLELAKAWRDDARYPEVCKQILERIYPDDLRTAAPNPSKDRAAAERWFANQTGSGNAAVRRMTQLYTILSEADLTQKPGKKANEDKKRGTSPDQAKPKRIAPTSKPALKAVHGGDPLRDSSHVKTPPGVSINLEIHISADATPDQIDRIFESMARHIYKGV